MKFLPGEFCASFLVGCFSLLICRKIYIFWTLKSWILHSLMKQKLELLCPPIWLLNFSPKNQSLCILLAVFLTFICMSPNNMIMYILIYQFKILFLLASYMEGRGLTFFLSLPHLSNKIITQCFIKILQHRMLWLYKYWSLLRLLLLLFYFLFWHIFCFSWS